MSRFIGSTITGFGPAVQVSTFSGPKGARAVAITPMSGPIDHITLREEEARKLIQLLEAALREEHIGDL